MLGRGALVTIIAKNTCIVTWRTHGKGKIKENSFIREGEEIERNHAET